MSYPDFQAEHKVREILALPKTLIVVRAPAYALNPDGAALPTTKTTEHRLRPRTAGARVALLPPPRNCRAIMCPVRRTTGIEPWTLT